MKSRQLGAVALVLMVLTGLWLVLLAAGTPNEIPLTNNEGIIAGVPRMGFVYYATYVNAALITLVATVLMVGLHYQCRTTLRGWARVGLTFVPVYCVLNLLVYLSQVTLVPRLAAMTQVPATRDVAFALLTVSLQQWSASSAAFFNGLAYAVLAIPSILYGFALAGDDLGMPLAGWALALNGLACIAGAVGTAAGSVVLANGSLLGGVLFLIALFDLSRLAFREKELLESDEE